MADAYPLAWPPGWERTQYPKAARFKTNPGRARDKLVEELRRMKAKNIVISTNVELKADGMPYANRRPPDDPGVAVYFMVDGMQQCIPCDRWDTVADNMQAIRLTVEALRGIERWGSGKMMKAAFAGFKALPPAAADRPWWEVLKCESFTPNDTVKDMYRQLARINHPDRGGNITVMAEINAAYFRFRTDRGLIEE